MELKLRNVFGFGKPWEIRSETPTGSYPVPDLTTSPPSWGDVSSTFISVDQALTIPAVQRSVTILTTATSQLDLQVTRAGTKIDSSLVARPDSNRSASAFIKRTTHDLVTTGNAYWRLYRNSDGAVVNMIALPPSLVNVRYDDSGTKFYEYTNYQGKTETLRNNTPLGINGQVEHLRLGEHENHILGRGPIQINNAALYSILELRYYTDRFLRESRRPSGIYTSPGFLGDDELDQMKTRIMDNRSTGTPDVLSNGITYQSIMFTPEALQLIDLNKAATLDVARMFGIPAPLLMAGIDNSSMTYQNMLTIDMQLVRYTLEAYLTGIEDAFSNVLPRGQEAKFETDGWLRASVALAAAAGAATQQFDTTTNTGGSPTAN